MLDAAEAGPTFNVPPGQVVGVLAGGAGAFEVPVENAEDDREGGAAAMTSLGSARTTPSSASRRADARPTCSARSPPRTRRVR